MAICGGWTAGRLRCSDVQAPPPKFKGPRQRPPSPMATANASPQPRPRRISLWRRPLLVGVCFALGYGLTLRLLDLRLPALVQWGQSFEPRDRPGTSLESLRLQFGTAQQELRGRLDLQELESQQPGPDDAVAAPESPLDSAVVPEALTPAVPQLPAADPPPESRPSFEAPPAPRQP